METTLQNRAKAQLLMPIPGLSHCIFAAFQRDTRGANLHFHDRFNHFSASPLCAVSYFFEGASHHIASPDHRQNPTQAPIFAKSCFSGPQTRPVTSWNESDVNALMVVLYPEALVSLTGLDMSRFVDRTVDLSDPEVAAVSDLFAPLEGHSDAALGFEALQNGLEPIWQMKRPAGSSFEHRLSDWSQSLALRAALSASGTSLRQLQRRIKSWTGQPLRRIKRFSKAENAYVIALEDHARGQVDIAGVATQAGFADQSHMGRAVLAQTGFSSLELLRRIEHEEAFWSYRLIGQQY